ncbi:MAG: T9SS type A sorting domain-containing protein [Flavobacteriales bacterium]
MKKISLLLILTVFCVSAYAVYPAGTYYIGGKDSDFKSIREAFDSLYEKGVGGSVTLKVRSGFYPENFVIRDIKRASFSDVITLESESGNNNDVVIQYTADGSADNYLVKLDSTFGITIQNLSFVTTGQQYYQQVCLRKSAMIQFIGNKFVAPIVKPIIIAQGEGNTCIAGTNSEGYNDNIRFDKNTFYGGYMAINICGDYMGHYDANITISNNTFKNANYSSINAYMADNMDIYNNAIYSNEQYYAISLYQVLASKSIKIHNNYSNKGNIDLGYCMSTDGKSNNIKIYNNRVVAKGNALNLMGTKGAYVYHNSFLSTEYAEGNQLISLSSDSALDIRNNLCISQQNPYYSVYSNQDIIIDNNAYFSSQNTFCPNLEVFSFSDWKERGYDKSGVEVDKISFIDDDMTTLRLASAQDTLISSFNDNNSYPEDCDKELRDKQPYYGADEYVYKGNPVAFLKGTIFCGKDTVKAGKVILYADVSNNKIFDIVDEQEIDIYGHYQIENFVQRNYILKVIPSETVYPDLIPTYNGTVMDWEKAIFFQPDSGKYTTVDIDVIRMEKISSDTGSISGYVYSDGSFKTNDPIPGLDIILDKIPPSASVKMVKTDANGFYQFNNLPMGNYKVNLDLPGIGKTAVHQVDLTPQNADQTNVDYCVENTVNICGGATGKKENTQNVNVYPNPFSTALTIVLPANFSSAKMTVYDILGQEVLTQQISAGDTQFVLSTESLSNGAYLLQMTIDGEVLQQKVMKQ